MTDKTKKEWESTGPDSWQKDGYSVARVESSRFKITPPNGESFTMSLANPGVAKKLCDMHNNSNNKRK